ncbi:hypothetical protein KB213_00475 [Neokomagataea sp. TBRC 2177]|uniref:Uncharacterized protein n=1 Tax=Neokomagataea anthophila TaxID=2826925 RepID=A0ABS5E3Q6_9PROT|nr:hypothetical protein [Neokomagataea anthophila]MBR0558536.1 hypothetical protein [Neokomagataea anthophila]
MAASFGCEDSLCGCAVSSGAEGASVVCWASGRLEKIGGPESLLFSADLVSSSGLRLLNKGTPLRI